MRSLIAALLFLPVLGLGPTSVAHAEDAPLPTVAQVDLTRYTGRWYEIALLPNRFQRQCVADTQANYRLTGERIEVINRCRMADGRMDDIRGHAKVVPDSGNARLRVTFFWPFYGDYWILALDEGYTEVLVGAPNRRYAWVLAREPQLPEARLNALLDRAAALGFDRSAFQRTPQSAAGAAQP
ncbi:lipocalin family protein [Pelomonas sp. APW6]|uniref:Outer membrane lipoprotein Blc n=1 Tax=Roseateles subflavus TaxID=3053353 RepID=A0ABT7LBT0_9BURK|nr:lipocalin family protein [Pelomonas sp. APW6]MDL5030321.1 lipocalin family protein [Pelomonas sp. APW6]